MGTVMEKKRVELDEAMYELTLRDLDAVSCDPKARGAASTVAACAAHNLRTALLLAKERKA